MISNLKHYFKYVNMEVMFEAYCLLDKKNSNLLDSLIVRGLPAEFSFKNREAASIMYANRSPNHT